MTEAYFILETKVRLYSRKVYSKKTRYEYKNFFIYIFFVLFYKCKSGNALNIESCVSSNFIQNNLFNSNSADGYGGALSIEITGQTNC